jgi:glutathione transport system substrate-binding protein
MRLVHRTLARPWVTAGALALGLATVLATAAPASAAKDVVVATASTQSNLDPYDNNGTLDLSVMKAFYQGLYGFDKDMKIVPVLAESFTVSADGLVYTVVLHKGVKFHDGTDFNAEAVKTNFDRVTNPANKLKRYNLFEVIARTDAASEYTVKITLKKPFSAFINTLAHPSAGIISPAALAKYGKEIASNPVGTGPFKFAEWKQTDYVKAVKNPAYWKKGLPHIDSVTFRPVADNNARAAIIQTGEAQFAYPVPYEQAEILKGKPDLEVVSGPGIFARYLALNTRKKPFDNLKVRQAINYAINKEALVKVAFAGYAAPAEGVVPPGVDFSVKTGPWPYDVAKAKALLAEAGYPNGFDVELWSIYNHTTARKVTEFVQQQLGQIGVRAKITLLETGQRIEKVENLQNPDDAQWQLIYMGWSSSTGEADWALRPLLASESFPPRLYNLAFYKSDKVDAGLQRALGQTDRTARAATYRAVQEQIWADAPWAFLVTERTLSVHNKNLSGFYVQPDGAFNFDEVDLK